MKEISEIDLVLVNLNDPMGEKRSWDSDDFCISPICCQELNIRHEVVASKENQEVKCDAIFDVHVIVKVREFESGLARSEKWY